MDFGARTSKTGKDAQTGIDLDQTFSSKFSTLKLYAWDDIELTTDGSGNGTVSVEHNMGYAPAHFVFRKGTASLSFLDASSYSNAFVPITGVTNLWMSNNYFRVYTDSTHLVIETDGQDASTTYYFRYYILVDLAQVFTGSSGISKTNDFGLKISQDGHDVRTAEEYQMAYSQKYKSLQYYDENYKTQELTLPYTMADPYDLTLECGTYVDINHGLGYPPFFIAYALNGLGNSLNVLIPYQFYTGTIFGGAGFEAIDGFCDSTRVRLTFYRKSIATATSNGGKFEAKTIKLKCFIFTEDLLT
jgi:hypothetical protein